MSRNRARILDVAAGFGGFPKLDLPPAHVVLLSMSTILDWTVDVEQRIDPLLNEDDVFESVTTYAKSGVEHVVIQRAAFVEMENPLAITPDQTVRGLFLTVTYDATGEMGMGKLPRDPQAGALLSALESMPQPFPVDLCILFGIDLSARQPRPFWLPLPGERIDVPGFAAGAPFDQITGISGMKHGPAGAGTGEPEYVFSINHDGDAYIDLTIEYTETTRVDAASFPAWLDRAIAIAARFGVS